MSIIAALLPVILQIVSWLISKSNLSTQQKKRFFEFVKNTGDEIKSVKLTLSAQRQLKELKNKPFVPEPGQTQTMEHTDD